MTIATEIESITEYDSTDVANAVTEGTTFCAMHDVTDDEIIKSASIWLLERLVLERKQKSDSTIVVPSILQIHDIIKSLKGDEVDTATSIITNYKSPTQNNVSPFEW